MIYLFHAGGPSHLDLFDYKPSLAKYSGQPCPPEFLKGQTLVFIRPDAGMYASEFKFAKHGQSGAELSEALIHLPKVADEIAIIKSMKTDAINHAPAQVFMQTGSVQFGRPSMGAWATYGLGSETRELPAFVVLSSGRGTSGGSALWGSGFLPTVYQGVPFRRAGDPILSLASPRGVTREMERDTLDLLKEINGRRLELTGDPEIATRINSFETAFRMQSSAPELMGLSNESKATLDLYGVEPGKASYAMNCLLARRLVERGVRFVQLCHEGWDHHTEVVKGIRGQCKVTDQASAALVSDLKQRGLLDDTIVIWGGEFGRTPMVETDPDAGRSMHRQISVLLAALACLWGLTIAALAQSTGEVTGVVTDASGAVIPGAELRLKNSQTGIAITAAANDEGLYRFTNLQPGAYQINVAKAGFASTLVNNVTVEVNRTARVDVTLKAGAVQEEVNVSAGAQLLDLESGTKGQIINSQQIENLPLQTKNPLALLNLTPGVVSPSGGAISNRQGSHGAGVTSGYSINGGVRTGTGGFNEFVVDGVSVMNRRDGTILGLPGADGLQEFRVQSGGMSAEFGHTVGGVINYVTKSGTNDFHGTLFENHRSTATNARRALPINTDKPGNIYNQFGGVIGGPVWLPKIYNGRDRTFFFFSYDGSRWVRKTPMTATVPTARMRNGDFSELTARIFDPASSATPASRTQFANNQIPQARWNPLGKKILDLFPLPTGAGTANNFQGSFNVFTPVDNYTWRVDHAFNQAHRVFFKMTRVDSVSLADFVLGKVDQQTQNLNLPSRNYTFNYNFTISPRLVYSATAGYTKFQRLTGDLSFLLAYTFSKEIDNAQEANFNSAEASNTGNQQNPYNLRDARAVGNFDRTHLFAGNVVYALPFGRGKRWLNDGWARRLAGGFQLTSIFSASSGAALAVTQSDANGLGVGGARPDLIGDPEAGRGTNNSNGSVQWINAGAYRLVNGRYGTSPIRDAHLRGPNFYRLDLGVQRDFNFTERVFFRFRAESFNALNHTNLGMPESNLNSPAFGQINAVYDPRIIQFGLQLKF